MELTSGRVTRIVDGLVHKELTHRESSTIDRRIYHLFLTEKGQKLTHQLIQDHIKIHQDILDQIPKEFQSVVLDSLCKLNEAVETWLKGDI